jgi:hypothetical protein
MQEQSCVHLKRGPQTELSASNTRLIELMSQSLHGKHHYGYPFVH